MRLCWEPRNLEGPRRVVTKDSKKAIDYNFGWGMINPFGPTKYLRREVNSLVGVHPEQLFRRDRESFMCKAYRGMRVRQGSSCWST